jgi:hypothetical protein
MPICRHPTLDDAFACEVCQGTIRRAAARASSSHVLTGTAEQFPGYRSETPESPLDELTAAAQRMGLYDVEDTVSDSPVSVSQADGTAAG